MKKAQIEIVGLMLIVILLTVLAVVFLRFTLKPGTSAISEARQSTMVSAAIDSIIKTSYNDKTFEDLVYDCYTGLNCNILTDELNSIMSKLMPKKPFYFTFSSNQQQFLDIGINCLGIQANKIYIINSIPVEIGLKLC